MDESERSGGEPGPAEEPRQEGTGGGADASSQGAQQFTGGGEFDGQRRRRRGRRGRGGGFGPRGPQFGGRPQFGGQPFRGPQPFQRGAPQQSGGREEDEQARELAAYERRQAQRQRGGQQGWRGGGQRGGGGWRQPRGGQQGYAETIRRVTAGPRTTAPSHAPVGEPIAGPHAILEAIRAGRNVRRLYVSDDRNLRTGAVNELITEAQQRRLFVRYVDKLEIARLSPIENHQGVVAIVEGKAGVELDELLLHLETLQTSALVLVIDSLQDPQNFGVLLRSAEGAGADGIVIPHHRAVGLTPAVAKTSAGASEHLMVADVVNLRQAIDALKAKGLWVVGADESGDLLYDEVDYRGPTAIVIGGEGEGIRRLVLEGCDQVVRIPMEGHVSSLNAAAAGTVVLYEALRQRRRDAPPAQTRTPRPEQAPSVSFNGEPGDGDADDAQAANATAPEEAPALEAPPTATVTSEEAEASKAETPDAKTGPARGKPEKPKRARAAAPRKRVTKKPAE